MKPYVLDFYCPNAYLVIEVDGDIHDQQTGGDAARTAYPKELGYRVLRFRNEEVLHKLDRVLEQIAEVALC